MTEKSVAGALGCSVGNVKKQHSRAMARLRVQLGAKEEVSRERQ